MDSLIKSFLRKNQCLIAARALKNCHARGLDSIVIHENPIVRIFMTRPDHELWMNYPNQNNPLSVGFHPHHCNLQFFILQGELTNILAQKTFIDDNDEWWNDLIELDCFEYQSKISKNEIKFNPVQKKIKFDLDFIFYKKNVSEIYKDSFKMKANQIHTVYVPKRMETIWAIFEDKEDPNYIPYTYSNVELDKQDFSHLYLRPTNQEVLDMIEKVEKAIES